MVFNIFRIAQTLPKGTLGLSHPTKDPPTHYHQSLAHHQFTSVSLDLTVLVISYKWADTICSLLCLGSFTQNNVFRVHVWYSMYQ